MKRSEKKNVTIQVPISYLLKGAKLKTIINNAFQRCVDSLGADFFTDEEKEALGTW